MLVMSPAMGALKNPITMVTRSVVSVTPKIENGWVVPAS